MSKQREPYWAKQQVAHIRMNLANHGYERTPREAELYMDLALYSIKEELDLESIGMNELMRRVAEGCRDLCSKEIV